MSANSGPTTCRGSPPRSHHPTKAINHTDEELEFLARLVDQRTAWQILGRKGVKDGMGYMEERPGQAHPAASYR